MIRPTSRAVILTVTGLVAACLPVFISGRLWPVWVVWMGLVTLAIGLDALEAWSWTRAGAEISTPTQLFIGESSAATLRLVGERPNASRVHWAIDRDDHLVPIEPGWVDDIEQQEVEVPLVARERGMAMLHRVWIRGEGRLGLVEGIARVALDHEIAIVPNIRAVRRAALRYSRHQSFMVGVNVMELQGDGSEFDSMREYVRGLDHRTIDWKASARHRKLLSREFHAERDQQVMFLVDTGRLMAEPVDGIPKLDHAINAALLSSYFSLRNGDRVGWVGFDSRVHTFVEPRGGVRSFGALQQAAAQLEYNATETNFTLGFVTLSSQLHRRSLIVLFTDLVDAISAELMLDALDRLSRRHLVLFVTLSDPELTQRAERSPVTDEDLAGSVVANQLGQERHVVLQRLQRMGVRTLDSSPDAVSMELLNHYLEIKRREMIA